MPPNSLRHKASGRPTCWRPGIVDAIVPEHPDAADEPVEFCQRLSRAIAAEVHALRAIPAAERLAARLQRYRRIGLPGAQPARDT